jgi:3-oxoacid CoA-transferase
VAIDKIAPSAADAVADVTDGSSIALAGFGQSHRFPKLIPALLEQGARDLCAIANSTGARDHSLQTLIEHHRVTRLIVSFSARATVSGSAAEDQIAAGEIDVELVPQGTLVERLRAGGSGIGGIYTRTGVGTAIADGKEVRVIDGDAYLFETALKPDYAFVRAARGDRFGNLEFHGVSRNFNPSFAKAGRVVIAEVDEIVDDAIDPERVGLPGIFVSRVVQTEPSEGRAAVRMRSEREADLPRRYNDKPGWTRAEIAEVAAGLLPEPSYVNLGVGLPTAMANYTAGRDVVFHAENGILGFGGVALPDEVDPDVYTAGSQFVRLLPGASFFDSVTAFEMVRSGKVNVVALGAFQVDEEANLANWAMPNMVGGGIGGAMDLAAGGGSVFALMTHLASNGEQKLVHRCSYPVTGLGCVDVIVTDLAVLRRVDGRFRIERVAPRFTPEEVAALTEMAIDVD